MSSHKQAAPKKTQPLRDHGKFTKNVPQITRSNSVVEAAATQDQRQIPRLLDLIDQELNQVELAASSLYARLEPVTEPGPPVVMESEERKVELAASSIGQHLQTSLTRLQALRESLHRVTMLVQI
jgi:hypothetical protein